ncbi:hypothetical protein XSR1_680014 [Xenorhabdus szentirmaii DSM 16338]|uniref:T6SS Phospholipase effector Tle1-like C-terminal domain-containing protein n=1 Tax=Xenorhabdus szentirmaii DSM 16338 TaxID=1427518 RepID=W1J6X7_9GAMM|nr:hypothetical protein [Xenorhabdus szentirmaii]PHM30380.1 hypothetical protein Xsze_04220 [Xenorhabdus szentirmaii DSM 16338]CDL85240.1 hypothetical protein XSR1_680014 [Xenorhabdus szentirmaii DSM 16338]
MNKAVSKRDDDKAQNRPVSAQYLAGKPLFESKRDKTQLSEAAAEFRSDYHNHIRNFNDRPLYMVLDVIPKYTMYLLNSDDEEVEYAEIKAAGEKYKQLLFQENGEPSKDKDYCNIVGLFDDQVHDSRAWFMHFETGAWEPWAGYFRYRMIYFGEQTNKALSPIATIPFMPDAEKLLQPTTDAAELLTATRTVARQNQMKDMRQKLTELLINSDNDGKNVGVAS